MTDGYGGEVEMRGQGHPPSGGGEGEGGGH